MKEGMAGLFRETSIFDTISARFPISPTLLSAVVYRIILDSSPDNDIILHTVN